MSNSIRLDDAVALASADAMKLTEISFKRALSTPANAENMRAVRSWARTAGLAASRMDQGAMIAKLERFKEICADFQINESDFGAVEAVEADENHNNKEDQPMPAPTPATELEEPTDEQAKLRHAIEILAAAAQPKAAPKVDEETIIRLIKKHAPVTEIVIKNREKGADKNLGAQHKAFKDLLELCAQRVNAYLCGPAGSGKTTAAANAAKALDLPFYSCGALGAAHSMLGYMNATGDYVRTAFREAFEHGGVFLWDEIDGSIPGEAIAVNDAIAAAPGSQCAFPDGMVTKHDDFVIVAAANTIGNGANRQYVGRYKLDGASLDRFAHIEWEYDEKLERSFCGDDEWVDFVCRVRKAVDTLNIEHIVSPRASMFGARMLAAKMSRAKVEQMFVWKGLSRDEVQRIKREV